MGTELTIEKLSDAMPKQVRGKIDQKIVDTINTLVQDPEVREMYRENIISYTNVLDQGKFKLTSYLDAVRYVSYKLLGETNVKSYIKTFPTKYADFKKNGVSDHDVGKYVHAYNKSKLVNLIWEQSMVPFHVLNQDARQKALNNLIDIMQHSNSDKVRVDAANGVLTHTAPPQTAKVELDIGVQDSSALDDLREVTAQLAIQQRQLIEAKGMTAKEVAHQSLVIEGEYDEQD